ncbi:MAG: hypothetical protein HRU15_12290, partial [Planctomycetes bacterium]|nr:hypothetical protein [Planctomycetota bacterium]
MKQTISSQTGDPVDAYALAKAIRRSVDICGIKKIIPVKGWRHPSAQGQVSGILRLTMIVDGVRHVRKPTAEKVHTYALTAGEMIVVAPSGWSKPIRREAHRVIHIDCYPTFTRFALHAFKGAQHQIDDGYFHSDAPAAPAVRSLQQALIHLVEIGDEERLKALMP